MAEDVLSQGDSDMQPEAWSVKARMGSLWAVRRHHGPRPRRYHPAGARGAPVSSAKLTGRRWTEGVRTDEHGEFNEVFNVEDNWRNEEDDHDDAPWIGARGSRSTAPRSQMSTGSNFSTDNLIHLIAFNMIMLPFNMITLPFNMIILHIKQMARARSSAKT